MPPGKQGELVTVAHTIGLFAPALIFLVGLPMNKFVMPNWLQRYSIPPAPSPEIYYGARVAGYIGSLGIGITMDWGMRHLSSQWHIVGLRERPKLVNTGPFAYIRHPMYLCGMLLDLFAAAMYWNWMPLAGAALAITSFEEVILKNKKIGEAYKRYQKDVPYRVIPYIW
ncbi:isoprenylcysteine carboxyl methyltransferase [Ceratobasidium sp. AG-Ba]|nr:isoprenylcysteine carboxyl methyltransferase [Ceratobasidium sp. AG-Ba]